MIRKALLAPVLSCVLSAAALSPALAASDTPVDGLPSLVVTAPNAIPLQLRAGERDQYRAIFAAIRSHEWGDATQRLDAMPEGLLTPFARAELILAKGSPRVANDPLASLLNRGPELPQAAELLRLAKTRGIDALPDLPEEHDLVRIAGASRRGSARTTRSDVIAVELAPKIQALTKADKPLDAEALLLTRAAELSPEALTEWKQRIAWSFYLTGDDINARRLAAEAAAGSGEWAVQGAWVAGLAAWRQKDYAAASASFDVVTTQGRDYETRAAGLFWSARADTAAGRFERVQAKLRTASRLPETFYGLLACSSLGLKLPATAPDIGPVAAEWQGIARFPNVRVAAALTEIGEDAYADQLLRHQARIGTAGTHGALLHLAERLALPSAQLWLARNGPAGEATPVAARYPTPAWAPQSGWRVDPALIYAHALQESQFRTDAVSSSGAMGLMQLMPATAQLIARHKGESVDRSQLARPAVSFEYGQSYLEMLRDMPITQGLLPKIIAAYNAGPGAIVAWKDKVKDGGDPLIFIESIPYAETRGYVAIVLRNYWMYHRSQGNSPPSLKALAQGMWPRFPGLPGKTAIRIDNIVETARAD